ncbi:28651_t:CDS:1, partial [Racocetra persica]
SGSNDIMKAIPTKVRQQIYMVLGNLAFSDVTCEEGNLEHSFISNSNKQLINTINQYRTINDASKRREIEKQASALIRDVISIFYFRRHIQEPIVDYMWIENNKPFDPLFMDGIWDDSDVSNLVVQFCSFPLFGSELEDPEKMKVYTRARVIIQD